MQLSTSASMGIISLYPCSFIYQSHQYTFISHYVAYHVNFFIKTLAKLLLFNCLIISSFLTSVKTSCMWKSKIMGDNTFPYFSFFVTIINFNYCTLILILMINYSSIIIFSRTWNFIPFNIIKCFFCANKHHISIINRSSLFFSQQLMEVTVGARWSLLIVLLIHMDYYKCYIRSAYYISWIRFSL